MRKNLRFVVLTLAAVMLMGLISACSSSKNGENAATNAPSNNSSSTQEPSNSLDEATKDPFEITLALPIIGATPADLALVQDEMSKITKEKINATVKILPISIGTWTQQMNLMSSSGEKLDLVFEFGQGYSAAMAAGKIIPLDSLLEQYGAGIKQAIGPEYLASAKLKGETYAVPVYKDYTTGTNSILMDKALVDKHKIDVASIKGLDDLDQVFKTIKENEPGVVPFAVGLLVPADKYGDYDRLGNRFGVLPGFDNGLKVENIFESKEYEDHLNKMHSWFKAGYINKDAATSQINGTEMVKAGKAFSYFDGLKVGGAEVQSAAAGKELIAVPISSNTYATTTDATAGLWAISNNSKNPQRTMMFLDLMYSDKELSNLFLWGIEGKHYVKVSDNTIDYPEGVEATTVGYSIQTWMVPNQSIGFIRTSDLPNVWELTAEANQKAIKSKALGFAFNSEPVKNEITSLNNVIEQYRKALESGTFDPADKLPELRQKLKSSGIDKVIAEKQKQLDEWAALNK
ncbi:ABC transporter substrate-binding protein [Paenibacillus paridis]|uniref:ABC transporter substrate-binding protein n=1 Tax=Paenibacillus paridis TaxID=2583376 RepID=UPI00111CCA53|nr:ABC transporter substrate-binding protein [Paenibacillus paridis]